jgi:hypothetical protein
VHVYADTLEDVSGIVISSEGLTTSSCITDKLLKPTQDVNELQHLTADHEQGATEYRLCHCRQHVIRT